MFETKYENKSGSFDKNRKIFTILIFLAVVFFIFICRLFSIQIIEGQKYRKESEKISSIKTEIPALRGQIFDRNATLPIVINTDSFVIDITPGLIPEGYYDTVAMNLASYLGITKNSIDKKVPKNSRKSFTPIEIKSNVPFSTITNIAENITDMPGVTWRTKPVRTYVESGSMSHIIGYVGDITNEELKVLYNKGYNYRSIVGKVGIEKQYDKWLQGKNGYISRPVDVHGRVISGDPIIEVPKSGNNVILTIDSSIQRLAEKALGDRVGSVVVLKPATGEILAMVSYPYYDANIFSADDVSAQYNKLKNEKNQPLINRAVNAVYPPASTFKTIMTTAIINEGTFSPEKKIECNGTISYGNRVFTCHIKEPGHGHLDLKNALAQSCDVYYWLVGRDELGVEKISSYASEFGFGKSLKIDLPVQNEGFVPTSQWKERRFHEKWLGGDTMNMSIGQGYTLVTPLHVADMMAMVCNSGKIYRPHLMKEIRDPYTQEVILEYENEVLHSSNIPEEVWKQVQEDLRYSITNGTAVWPMHNKTVKIAGKTGTAEVGTNKEDKHWHSWMISYAPYDAPPEEQIVVVTLVEAVNDWEWWAPYCSNIIIQGIFNDQTYDEAVDALYFREMVNRQKRNQQ